MGGVTSRLNLAGHPRRTIIAVIIVLVIISSVSLGILYINQPSNNEPTPFTIDEYELDIKDIDPLNLSVEEWMEDFHALYSYVLYNNPYLTLKNRTHGYNWLDLRESYEDRINGASDNAEFFSIIWDSVEALQNRHTNIVDPEYYPLYRQNYGSWIHLCRDVFNIDVVSASDYWENIFNEYNDTRINTSYNAKIVYDRGAYRIVDGFGSWVDTYGNRSIVLEIDGVSIDDAVSSHFEKSYLEWDFAREKLFMRIITPHQFGDAVFTIRNSLGIESDVVFDIVNEPYENPLCYPATLSYPLIFKTWENESVAYIYFRSFSYYLEPYLQDVLDFLEQIEDYEHLIVDLRGNIGGSSSNWVNNLIGPLMTEPAVHETFLAYKNGTFANLYRQSFGQYDVIPKEEFESLPPEVLGDDYKIYNYTRFYEPVNQVNFNGTLSLLTDSVSYSASENLALFCEQSNFATIYGTTSGRDGVIPTPIFFTLPNSKLVIRIPPAIGLERNGEASEESRTHPDVYHESAFGDFWDLVEFAIEDITS